MQGKTTNQIAKGMKDSQNGAGCEPGAKKRAAGTTTQVAIALRASTTTNQRSNFVSKRKITVFFDTINWG